MVTPSQIKKRLAKRPFLPFRVVTNTGKKYDVLTPEFMMMANRVFAIGTLRNEGDEEMDGIHVMSVRAVESLESLPCRWIKK